MWSNVVTTAWMRWLSCVWLPSIVFMLLLSINGSLGTGLAVAGSFGLIRFRSQPAKAMDLVYLFFSMSTDVALVSGAYLLCLLYCLLINLLLFVLPALPALRRQKEEWELLIQLPEDLWMDQLFVQALETHCSSVKLLEVKSQQMGAIFRYHYLLSWKATASPKALLEDIRVRNGNLPVILRRKTESLSEL